MFRLLKKTMAVCMIGLGLGVLLVILLPFTGWLFIIGASLITVGVMSLIC